MKALLEQRAAKLDPWLQDDNLNVYVLDPEILKLMHIDLTLKRLKDLLEGQFKFGAFIRITETTNDLQTDDLFLWEPETGELKQWRRIA
jgi:hypothetical protein